MSDWRVRNGRFPDAGCYHASCILRGNGRAPYPATAWFRAANASGNRAQVLPSACPAGQAPDPGVFTAAVACAMYATFCCGLRRSKPGRSPYPLVCIVQITMLAPGWLARYPTHGLATDGPVGSGNTPRSAAWTPHDSMGRCMERSPR